MSARLIYGVDVVKGLRQIEDESVQCVVTSPPYWGLRDYGTASWEGGDASCQHSVNRKDADRKATFSERVTHGERSKCLKCSARRIDAQLGLEPTPEEYIEKMVAVFREVRRVLRKDGTAWVNMGDGYACRPAAGQGKNWQKGRTTPERFKMEKMGKGIKAKDLIGMPWMLAFALRADGWYLRSDVIWAKPNPMPESVTDRPTKAHEYIFLLTKSDKYFYDADAIREDSLSPASVHVHGSGQKTNGLNGFQTRPSKTWITGNSRNKRTVWEIVTQPYPEAHFATFPKEIPKLCILAGTSAHGACKECGTPWERAIEKTRTNESNGAKANVHTGWDTGAGDHRAKSGRYKNGKGLATNQARAKHNVRNGPSVSVKTTGWTPPCPHNAERIPCVVLDPFSGSATTGEVAVGLGRHYIGIDLNIKYLELAKKRLGLFVTENK